MSQVHEFETGSEAFERLGELWRAQVPSEVQVNAARARMRRRQLEQAKNGRRSLRRRAAIFVGGLVLGASGLAYAGWAPWQELLGWQEEAASTRPAAAPPAAQRPVRARPAATRHERPVRESKASAAPASEARVPAAQAAPAGQTPESGARRAASGDWADVARALRAGHDEEGQAHLDQLAQAGPPATREAARLARAQLWLSMGRSQEARHELRELAARAKREHVRNRARQLLDGMKE